MPDNTPYNRSRDVKISDMLGATTLTSGDYITIVQDGQNKKITVSDFILGLSVSGSLVQAGDLTAIPILDAQGNVNNIRGVEPGPGITASVTVNNGIEIRHAFAFDTTGAPLTPNSEVAVPIIRSIVAGPGISVGASGGVIQIASTDTPTSSKTFVVSALSDLPTPVADVITLEDDTFYLFLTDINFGVNRMVMGNNSVINGTDSSITAISYTGTNTFITATDVDCRIERISINCPNSPVMDATDTTGQKLVQLISVTVTDCDTIGTLTGCTAVKFNNISFRNCTSGGITLAGTIGTIYMGVVSAAILAGSFIDFGTSTVRHATFTDVGCALPNAGTYMLSGLTDSANIVAFATVFNTGVTGAGEALNGISVNDSRWQFTLNDSIPDSRVDGLLSLQANAIPTVIAASNTPVKVEGVWTVELLSQTSGDTTGTITLDVIKTVPIQSDATMSVEPVSGGSTSISAYIAINGTELTNSRRTTTASSGNPASLTLLWQSNLNTSDIVEVFIANDDNATNILVSSAVLRVNQ